MRICKDLLLRCKNCDYNFIVKKSDLDYDTYYSENRGMGTEITHQFSFECNCPNCKKQINLSLIATEYPVGAYNFHLFESDDVFLEHEPVLEVNYLDDEIKDTNFSIYHLVKKNELKTNFGLLTIKNIFINPTEFEQIISEMMNDLKMLEFIFSTKFEDDCDIINVYKRFLPPRRVPDFDKYIQEAMGENHNFYSFLAEALLAIILKDLYGYSLAKAVVDVTSTLVDSHTGADGCMYDVDKKVFVLGEAKFYQSLSSGMTKIINDFTLSYGFVNKMDNFYRTCTAKQESCNILLKQLKEDIYYEYSIDDFLKMNIIFAGFVLHDHTGKVEKYIQRDFYDAFDVSVNKVTENINASFDMTLNIDNFEITMLHLPINSKKNLIKLIMEKAREKLAKIRGGNIGETEV